jgi:hypothetical protein
MVSIWYPATRSSDTPAPYMTPEESKEYRETNELDLPPDLLSTAVTHSTFTEWDLKRESRWRIESGRRPLSAHNSSSGSSQATIADCSTSGPGRQGQVSSMELSAAFSFAVTESP